MSTASPCVATSTEAGAGKVAHYLPRPVNSRDEPGPWSRTISATITA